MRSYDSNTSDYLVAGEGIAARHLIWIEAKNRTTGATETMGIWNGDDTVTITIDGTPRTYIGAGGLIKMPTLTAGIGLEVRYHEISLSPYTAEVEQAIRGYDPRLAPIEVHRALFSLDTGALVGTPTRWLKGFINEVAFDEPEEGGEAAVNVSVASAARALTAPLALFKSDASMRRVSAADAFRLYSDVAGEVEVWWGEKRST